MMNLGTKEGATRAKELLKHFRYHGIRHDPKGENGLKLVLEWQDLIGKSSMADVNRFEGELPESSNDGVDMDCFLFACVTCLNRSMTIDIFRSTQGERWRKMVYPKVRKEFLAQEEDLKAREQILWQEREKLSAREQVLLQSLHDTDEIQKKLRSELALREQEITIRNKKIEELENKNAILEDQASKLEEVYAKWNTLRRLIADLTLPRGA